MCDVLFKDACVRIMSYTQSPPLSPDEVLEFLNYVTVARVCSHNKDGSTHAAPVWFFYEGGKLIFGTPDENSPVFFTTNFALTYYTVASDIENSKLNAFLIVVDTEGSAVDSGVAGRKLTAETVTEAIKETGIEKKVKHKKIIIPGKASRISGEIEELSGWKVQVGPRDSSEIPKYLQEKWQP